MLKSRLEKHYQNIVCEDFILLYNFENIFDLTRFERIILNSTSNNFISENLSVMQSFSAWFLESGHRPICTRARKSIATFGIRKKDLLGFETTCSKTSAWILLDKLLVFILPKLYSSREAVNVKTVSLTKSSSFRESSYKAKHGARKEVKPIQNRIFFTIGSQSMVSLPELSKLLFFFNSLSGFSFSCSIIQRDKVFVHNRKQDLARLTSVACESSTRMTIFDDFKKRSHVNHGFPLVSDNTSYIEFKRNQMGAQFISAFQLPHVLIK